MPIVCGPILRGTVWENLFKIDYVWFGGQKRLKSHGTVVLKMPASTSAYITPQNGAKPCRFAAYTDSRHDPK
jgi:hypothetical protein